MLKSVPAQSVILINPRYDVEKNGRGNTNTKVKSVDNIFSKCDDDRLIHQVSRTPTGKLDMEI